MIPLCLRMGRTRKWSSQAQFKNTIHILRWLVLPGTHSQHCPFSSRAKVLLRGKGRIKGQIGKICKCKHCSKFICFYKDRTYVRVDLHLRGWAHPGVRTTTNKDGRNLFLSQRIKASISDFLLPKFYSITFNGQQQGFYIDLSCKNAEVWQQEEEDARPPNVYELIVVIIGS